MEGGVMDASGTLSGGGTKMKPPQLGPQFSQSDNAAQARDAKEARVKLEKVDVELRKQVELTRELNEKIAENERKYQQLSEEKEKLEEGKRRLTNDTNNLNSRIVSLERSIDELKKVETTLEVDSNELERLRKELDATTTEHAQAKKELDEANDAYQKADAAVNRVYVELLGRFGTAANLAQQKITAARNDINTESMKLNTFEKDKKKIEAKVEGAKVMIENKEKELKKLENEENMNEQALNQLRSKKQEYELGISEMANKIKEARKDTSTQDEEENITIKLIDKMTDDYKTISENVRALEHNCDKIKKEISSLKLHRIKEYGILPEKIRKPAQHDHIIDEETLAEEKAHQKRMRRKKAEDIDDDADNSDGDDGSLPALTEEDLKECNRDELKFKLQQLQEKVRKNKEQLNMRIIEEYTEKTKKYTAEHGLLITMQDNHKKHMARMEEWKRVRLQEFMEGFTEIGKNLKEMYQMITLGGDASLDLKDSLDPFSEGIQFMVRPPKKSWKNIENLSGGEKTLSSLSLVFALHKYRPTPLYVMDEIDAALDFRNVSIIGHYVKEKTKNAQFIIISLRNNMFELGDRLVGIYKTFDCTKNVIVDPAEVMKQALPVRNALQMIHNVEQDVSSMDFTRIQASPDKTRLAAVRSSMEDLDLATNGARKRHSLEDASVPKRPDLRKSPVPEKPRASRTPSVQPL